MEFPHSLQQTISKNARLFIQLQIFFSGLSSILTLFVNTFLLQAYGSFSAEVLLYNAILAFTQPFAMLTALKLTNAASALVTQRVGFVFYGLSLTLLCLFGQTISSLYPLFAVMISFGAGYYYSIYSAQMMSYTSDSNRDLISGIISLFGSVISISLPLLSGFLITRFDTFTGYRIVFGIAALLAVAALLTTLHMSPIAKHSKEPALGKVCKTILQSRSGRWMMVANGLSNCQTFTVSIYVTLLFYNLVPNEMLISLNSTIGCVTGLLSAALYGGFIKRTNRVKGSVIGACAVMIPCVLMLFDLNIAIIMVFQAVYSLFAIFLSTPVINTHFKLMEVLGLGSEYGSEIHLFRELFVSAGRILGLLLVWIIPQTNTGAVIVLVTMMSTSLINAFILKKIERNESRFYDF